MDKSDEIVLTESQQIEIFQEVFLILIEIPSMREPLKKLIDAKERVDMAEVNLLLARLESEIINRNKGGSE